jgi:2-keto-4-pentenoate hydratase/2-oxohepta-3-ene-1,7-dioic acid hydratase in catechol pathway
VQHIWFEKEKIYPSKVICVGRNYVEHIHELGNEVPENMVLFNKPNSAITDTLYYIDESCRFEGEICFVMQQGCIAGVGFGLDLTKADLQNYLKSKGLPWERAKGFDGAAVFGEFVKFDGDLSTLEMKLYLNDTLQQHATYDLMIYKPMQIVDEIASFMTIEDGDIIMSGTPKGVTTYHQGDTLYAQIFAEGRVLVESTFTVQ